MGELGSPRSGAISARVVVRLADFVAARGHDADQLCRDVGLTLSALREAEARVPYAIVERLGMRALELTRDVNLGLHLAHDVRDSQGFDAGVLLLMSSPSLGVSLERMTRYQNYWADGERFALLRTPRGLALRYRGAHTPGDYQRHSEESALAEILLGARRLTERDVVPLAVSFRHPAPADTAEHTALFRAAIRFGAEHCEIELSREALALPLPSANEMFRAFFQQHVERALARLPNAAGTANDVRAAAQAALASGDCTLEATARALGTSARTLQRRLRADGTTFAALVDALRRELAQEYLAQRMPVQEIAHLLGYAEPSAFHHAFKRWTGTTPERARAAAK
jgi:AraC-like DNA-binding protein